jgi:hypothetical protein
MADILVPRPFGPSTDSAINGPVDERQSTGAINIARGTARCLDAHGFAVVPEMVLANGRRADVMGLSETSEVWIVEIKSSVEDFRTDQKWPEYRDFCDRFYFAVGPDFPRSVLPPGVGLIVADRYHGEVIRPTNPHRMVAARRKAVITRFARAAALRLHSHTDPIFERPRRT